MRERKGERERERKREEDRGREREGKGREGIPIRRSLQLIECHLEPARRALPRGGRQIVDPSDRRVHEEALAPEGKMGDVGERPCLQ